MDRVRFGRALGKGARAAARIAMEAAEAAAAPSPSAHGNEPAPSQPGPQSTTTATKIQSSRATILPPLHSSPSTASRARSVTGLIAPIRKASRALWHEVMGSFFALFALSFAAGVWRTRSSALGAAAGDRFRFYTFCALALAFAYFSISSFLRARSRP